MKFSESWLREWINPSITSEELQAQLAQAEIGTLIHYPIPPHMQGAYADLVFDAEAFPTARRLAQEVLSLPMGPQLDTSVVKNQIVPEILRND